MEAGGHIPGAPFKLFDAQGDLFSYATRRYHAGSTYVCHSDSKMNQGLFRFRYLQRVFREAEAEMQATAREMTQIGIESIGESGPQSDAEMISLFIEALQQCGLSGFKLAIGTVGVLRALLQASGADAKWKNEVLNAYHESNFVELDRLTLTSSAEPCYAQAIKTLPRIRGDKKAIAVLRELVEPLGCCDGLDNLEETYRLLEEADLAGYILVDFSVMSSFDYYTGIVVEAIAPNLGVSLGSGGRYDNLLEAYGQSRPAAGFAFYLEVVMSALSSRAASEGRLDAPLRIAVPKGSLNADTIEALAKAGLDTTGLEDSGRHLIIKNPGVEYIIVRPTDAPAFVALGGADCGICGKDSLLEADPDVVELVDLGFGACRFVVAQPIDAAASIDEHYRKLGSIRVATKYPNITQAYYAQVGKQVEIVKLHGNVELAPLTGLAERIVDITATGTTLRENDLVVVDEVLDSTARFFANVCSFRMDKRIVEIATALQMRTEER